MKNRVLENAKKVAKRSRFVAINQEALLRVAEKFNHKNINHWLSEAPFDFSNLSNEDKLSFLFIFNSISFTYWGDPKWTIEHKGQKQDGSWGMITSIGRAIEEGVPILDAKYRANISKEDFKKILRGNIEIPLLEQRWKIIQEIGNILCNNYDCSPEKVIEKSDGDALKFLNEILDNFPSFRDMSKYKNEEIYFNKRAQLLVSDIYQIFDGKKYGNLKNIECLTAAADYKLPMVLRELGILEYESSLAKKIDSEAELEHGSEEEVEIRANTIWAVELLRQELEKRGSSYTSIQINDHLWLLGQDKLNRKHSYHLTKTTAY